ncbi:MAG TPA: UxaA family hydrolase [Solirubrobacteraceae bacterium]|nr:UxaA family hydrolase [Solirubrobacteraceae bacterium]
MSALTGLVRHDGRAGIRNHVLVLPSVVCSTHAASEIASAAGAVAITHQHGCLHVGDDLRHTEQAFLGTATNPNVGAVVVVSLGCETLNGKLLADRIAQTGQTIELIGVQHSGGTARAIQDGLAACARLSAALDALTPEPIDPSAVTVGIDDASDALAGPLREALEARGLRVALADDVTGPEAHVELACQGSQLIVSLPGEFEGPTGFPVCPVVAVGRDVDLHRALADDFDVHEEAASHGELAQRVADRVLTAAAGEPTASERRGARDFVLRRLAVTM